MTDQQQYIADQERRRIDEEFSRKPAQSTLETVGLERRNAPLPVWQQWMVNALAVIGAIAIIYVVLNGIGVF